MSENKVTVFGKNAEERLEILRDEKGNILLTDDQKEPCSKEVVFWCPHRQAPAKRPRWSNA